MAAALGMGVVLFSNMVKELGFDTHFDGVSLYLDNTSALHHAGNWTHSHELSMQLNRTSSPKALVNKGRITAKNVKNRGPAVDSVTERLSKQRQRSLLRFISEFRA